MTITLKDRFDDAQSRQLNVAQLNLHCMERQAMHLNDIRNRRERAECLKSFVKGFVVGPIIGSLFGLVFTGGMVGSVIVSNSACAAFTAPGMIPGRFRSDLSERMSNYACMGATFGMALTAGMTYNTLYSDSPLIEFLKKRISVERADTLPKAPVPKGYKIVA